ncbi:MAG: aspartyl protease family protein [Pseudomonadota bacterium]|nr:aspartyl protease family protein [Pseudomonadota bacterium]
MRWLAALLLPVLVAAAAPPPLAPPPPPAMTATLADDAEAHWVPFTLTSANQIRFTAEIGGSPVIAVLDTGVSTTAVSRSFAGRAHLDVLPGGRAAAIGGSVSAGWVRSPPFGFGGLAVRATRLAVVLLPANATGGEPVDLLVGRDLLARFALDIDYDQARFRLLPSGRMPFPGASAPLRIGGLIPVYLADVAIGHRRFPRMIVDTGDGNSVTVSRDAWQGDRARGDTTTTLSFGIGGPIVAGLTIVPSVRLGDLRSGATEVTIEDPAFSRATGTSGRIGSGFLQRYRVLLDPAAGHIVLASGKRADVPPLRSTSGLLIARAGDRLRVLHVMRNSPAASAGWRTGDAICTVDGDAVGPGNAVAWPAGKPGRTVSLGLCDGTNRLLMLREFY